ncbi:MAG: DUF2924 domain-containing protein [Pseudomonadota bacterium]|nr:DUF2924 domain-containing protein [Pseudomonadota bacterium]
MMTLEQRLTALTTMSPAQLAAEWQRVLKSPAPAMTPDLLRRGIAYRLQEQVHGGLKPSLIHELERIGGRSDRTEPVAVAGMHIKPGTRLVRDWGGATHHVLVDEQGFCYRDQRYSSLSEIASTITGTKWSGPRFFGLRGRGGRINA